jgi:hypothetical protein
MNKQISLEKTPFTALAPIRAVGLIASTIGNNMLALDTAFMRASLESTSAADEEVDAEEGGNAKKSFLKNSLADDIFSLSLSAVTLSL